jgi:hypothetical protein
MISAHLAFWKHRSYVLDIIRTLRGFHYNGLHKIAWLGWALGLASGEAMVFHVSESSPSGYGGIIIILADNTAHKI